MLFLMYSLITFSLYFSSFPHDISPVKPDGKQPLVVLCIRLQLPKEFYGLLHYRPSAFSSAVAVNLYSRLVSASILKQNHQNVEKI